MKINCLICSFKIKSQFIIFGLNAFLFLGLFAGTMSAASPGALDVSFANRGVISFGNNVNGVRTRIEAMTNQPDGKLIVVGDKASCANYICTGSDFLIARFNFDGTPDISFGTNGIVLYDHVNQNETATAVAVQPDGKIVIVGGKGSYTPNPVVTGFKVVRFMPDGTVDTTFGSNGFVYENFNNSGGNPTDVYIQSDGKILVVGTTETNSSSVYTLHFARFNANGSMDSSFGANGIFTKNMTTHGAKAVKQSDNKIIIVTSTSSGSTLSRYNEDGSLDSTYGNGGSITYNYYFDSVVAIQPNDKVIGISSGISQSAFYRFNTDGTRDMSFVPNNCSRCTDKVQDIKTLPDGRFYVVGQSGRNVAYLGLLSVSRYLNNGTIDPSFGFRGSSYLRTLNGNSESKLSVKPDGTINVIQLYNNLAVQLYGAKTPPTMRSDFDGDKKTDYAVFRPSNNYWYVSRSSDGVVLPYYYGANGDIPLSGDFDYDKRIDLAIFRPSNNIWSFQPVVDNGPGTVSGGMYNTLNSDFRVPEDYDGDGYTDVGYFRPSEGNWYVNYSSSLTNATIKFGQNGDIPVPADYDGDGRTDIAVFRPSNGVWYILRSSDYGFTAVQWGLGTDKLVPGDYDGDGKTDIAVFRDGNCLF